LPNWEGDFTTEALRAEVQESKEFRSQKAYEMIALKPPNPEL
jgi:hypothetical protein